MELKTQVNAEEGKQELVITREFDLPVDLLFRAYTEADIVAQWMGTKVLKLENRNHGGYEFETTDPQGNKHHGHPSVGSNGTLFKNPRGTLSVPRNEFFSNHCATLSQPTPVPSHQTFS